MRWGPVRPRKRPPRQLALLLLSGVSQSVSSQYHTVTTPAGRSSFSESQNRLSIHPPRSYTLEVRLGKGANLASDQIPLSPPYFAYSLGCCHPSRGPGPLRERERDCVVQYSKHMCVTCMCEVELCTFFRPLARLYKAHFSLHETQNLEWLNMVKEF